MWDWLDTTRGKNVIKGITLGTLATLVTLFTAWGGAMFSYATLNERVERSREDIVEMQKTVREQTNILHKIDTTVAMVDARVAEHMRQTQNGDRR